MLNKFIKKPKSEDKDLVFPKQNSSTKDNLEQPVVPEAVTPVYSKNVVNQIVTELVNQPNFIKSLVEEVTESLLEKLSTKYGFEPTDKYKEEIESKKEYINQLDNYLQERREINKSVENELQKFLNETNVTLTRALEGFSHKIQSQIQDAQSRHGVDVVRETLTNLSKTKE